MSFLDNLSKITTGTYSDSMGQAVEEMVEEAIKRRRAHERRWFDNNFFDDGYHFRAVSKTTGKVIDSASRTSGYVERAIPRASRQIRGVSNLLFAAEPYPVVYPKRISMAEFPQVPDPKTGQMVPSPEYDAAIKQAKEVAQKQGIWLSTEWEDEQHMMTKMLDMFLLAAKNSISYLQVSSDTKRQKIITEVFDAFDIVTYGDLRSLGAVPFITKIKSMDLKEVKTSPLFEESKVAKLTPDNKYATSEIKDAYMRSRYGMKNNGDSTNSILVKETFIKEYLSEDNWKQAIKLSADNGAMEGKSIGDDVMRHVFSAGGVTLNDEYIDYDDYPFAEFRFEPGPLYQVPFIERFIPQNKSLDIIVTRLEKFVNSMVVGVYQGRKGENFQVSNFPGGQKIEYETSPLEQMNITNPGNAPFEVIALLNKYIEEQGASTSVLGQIPTGVKGQGAIENLQQQEYSNLKMATLMFKRCMKRTAELMLERAHKDFLSPVEVSSIQDGQPQYFDVIGKRGFDLSNQVQKELPQDVVTIDKTTKVRIEIEPGLGLTMDGKKQAMQGIIDYMLKLYQEGFIAPEAMQQVLKKFLETFGYGSTEEFMEAMENGVTAGQMSDNQIKQMQIAMAQTLKDVGAVGPQADQKLVTASKVGTLQSLKDAGVLDKMNDMSNAAGVAQDKLDDDMVKIYKDAPPDIRRQIETKLGLQPSENEPIAPIQAETAKKISTIKNENAQTTLQANQVEKEHQLKQQALSSADIQAETSAALKAKEIEQKSQNMTAPVATS
jgi:hypothetical protein